MAMTDAQAIALLDQSEAAVDQRITELLAALDALYPKDLAAAQAVRDVMQALYPTGV